MMNRNPSVVLILFESAFIALIARATSMPNQRKELICTSSTINAVAKRENNSSLEDIIDDVRLITHQRFLVLTLLLNQRRNPKTIRNSCGRHMYHGVCFP